jgi:predicted O-linked N-acetylglucosamine transferase (SPINDLY family)
MSQHAAKLEQVRMLMGTRPEQAKAMCQRIAASAPKDPWVASVMSSVFLQLGQTPQALHYAQRAADLAPSEPYFQVELARLLGIENQHPKALQLMRQTVAAHPEHLGPIYMLASTLEQMDLHGEAERTCRMGLAREPENEGFQALLAGALLSLGRIEETVALTQAAADRHPDNPLLASGLALMLNYMPGVAPTEVFAAHRRYADLLDRLEPSPTREYANVRDPNKKLRVGIVSPDLRQHSVAYFIEPWFEHLNQSQPDRAQLELYVYQTNRIADTVTAKLKQLVTKSGGRWQVMDNISDAGLAEKIFADRIDVLLELSGHTHAHSLPAMRLRPAPVQVTYLGYPNTTGLREIDYRIVDSHTDPAGAESVATEKLLRLDPCFLCYQPPQDVPDDSAPPSMGKGNVTFGSFNTVQKLNREVIRVWAAILRTVPNSKLLLKGGHADDAGLREGVLSRFVEAGVEPGRVEFLPRTKGTREHLELYSRIDIALDPFPYNGTTTTCEALLMGVPVVTLAGQTHAGRVGASLLNCVGEAGLIATDEAEYRSLAASLAEDEAKLMRLRSTLRRRLLKSPVCDAAGFAARMQGALRSAWSHWCAVGS